MSEFESFDVARVLQLFADRPIFGGTAHADDDPPPWADATWAIPDVAGLSAHDAALAYAKAGVFIVPTDPTDVKNPGSLLGNRWQDRSSIDADRIAGWWTDHPNAGIAADVGRSGLIAFDLDCDERPAEMTDDVWSALQTGAIHATRATGARAHYVFSCQPDEFGNGAGVFGRWGEVRCSNGVIILAPTQHPDAKTKRGRYGWRRTGDVPPLPDVLRALLSAAGNNDDPKTPAELLTFLAAHTGNDAPSGLQGHLTAFAKAIERGQSRHDEMTKVMAWAFREAIIGRFPAQSAYDALKLAFYRAKPETKGTGEFDRIARWAAAQAETADPETTRRRVNRASDDETFWSARPALADMRQFARARRVGPWAMLGHVLARTVSAIPPHVVLPPLVGSHASLNLFVALVGRSGAGKGGAAGAAADWLGTDPEAFLATLGSGEGMAKVFAYKHRANGNSGPWTQTGLRVSVLFDAPEVDNLAALTSRNASTLLPQLRSAYSGEELGFSYADPAKAVKLCAHRYRLCLTIGVQPGRGRALLDDADGGTPQRFVWLPTDDANAPERAPSMPPGFDLPRWPDPPANGRIVSGAEPVAMLATPVELGALHLLDVPDAARTTIDAHRLAMLRGGVVDPLDGHRLLCRLKIAAALMALDGRTDAVTEDDWALSETVMAVADSTRRSVVDVLVTNAEAENLRRGRSEGVRADAAEQIKTDRAVSRVAENLLRKLKASGGEMARADLRKMFASRDRPFFDDAEAALFDSGRIDKAPSDNTGPEGFVLRLADQDASK
ncbi:MAG: bifunctional DNA primase/polymerase [Actinobacteria bacterium]|nr:bifunctional DNA primase/polymerase [Actinomycetota bacterium]